MVKSNSNNPVKYSNKLVMKAQQDDTGRRYKKVVGTIGQQNEQLYFNLAQMLEVEDVYYSQEGSALDEFLKVDLVLELDEEENLVLQIKSTEEQVDNFLENNPKVYYKNLQYPTPPASCADKSNLELLFELSEFLGIPVRKKILEAIELVQVFKKAGAQPPASVFRSTSHSLQKLGLVKVSGGRFII